jgi:hypothetical protein
MIVIDFLLFYILVKLDFLLLHHHLVLNDLFNQIGVFLNISFLLNLVILCILEQPINSFNIFSVMWLQRFILSTRVQFYFAVSHVEVFSDSFLLLHPVAPVLFFLLKELYVRLSNFIFMNSFQVRMDLMLVRFLINLVV